MKIVSGSKTSLVTACAAVILGAVAAAPAMAASLQTVAMPATVAPFGKNVKILGEAKASDVVRFSVALKLRDYAGLTASNQAGRKMPWAELEARHLPTVADYDAVLNFLTKSGLTIVKKNPNRLSIDVSGAAPEVSRALGVHFSRIAAEGKQFVAADTAPAIPADVAAKIEAFGGLQPHLHFVHQHQVNTQSATAAPYYAQAFLSAYNAEGVGNGGEGTTTAIVIDTFPLIKDLKQYWSITGTQQKANRISLIKATDAEMNPLSGEESMDAQVSSSVAPNSHVAVYASGDLFFSSLDTTFEKMIEDQGSGAKLDQVSISLGLCEVLLPPAYVRRENNYFAIMASQGSSIFVSSGDHGSDECRDGTAQPSWFATSPNVTSVGGTTLKLKDNGKVRTEIGWSLDPADPRNIASGGGISTVFKRPKWQKALGYEMRAEPDISTDGDPNTGALVIIQGNGYQIGGTSLSAPIMAGLTALLNANRYAQGKPAIGLMNPALYQDAAGTAAIRDITEGDNGAYEAGPGYDLVTGLGVPNVAKLDKVLNQ
jgi:kumamolisin